MEPSASRIYVAGHRGMVGSAIVRALQAAGESQLILRTHAELDLVDQRAVNAFFEAEKPDQVYLAAARVGGIHANETYPADFIYDNLMIQSNVIQAAHAHGVQKLLFLGSSCIYPRLAAQPMAEDAILTGPLEPTNEPYAIAKIAGIKLCESYARQHGRDYRSVMPTNLYGPGDNYHPENSHVIPGLIRRIRAAMLTQQSEVVIWGSGNPLREFLYVDDLADACMHLMHLPRPDYEAHTRLQLGHINVGSGQEVSIADLARLIAKVIGFEGALVFDARKADGTPRKLMDSTRMNSFGWNARTRLDAGIRVTYQDFLAREFDHDRATPRA